MATQKEYLSTLGEQSEIYDVLQNIVADYTGGACDANTQGGNNCWEYNQNNEDCAGFCLQNLDNWLLPLLLKSQENLQDLVLEVTPNNNLNQIFNTLLSDYKGKEFDNTFESIGWRLQLSFTNHPILSSVIFRKTVIIIGFLKQLDRHIYQQITNMIGDVGVGADEEKFNLHQGRSGSFFLAFDPDDIANIYNDLFIPFLQFDMQNNVNNNITIECEYSIYMDGVDDNILINWLNNDFNYNMPRLEIMEGSGYNEYDYDKYKRLYGAINSYRITEDLNDNYLFYLPELNIGNVEVDIHIMKTEQSATHFYLESFTTFII